MKKYTITTVAKEFSFIGKHRKDLERPNWHFFEKQDGKIIHFRKENLVAIEEEYS